MNLLSIFYKTKNDENIQNGLLDLSMLPNFNNKNIDRNKFYFILTALSSSTIFCLFVAICIFLFKEDIFSI